MTPSIQSLIGYCQSAETFIAHPDLDYGKRPHATVPIDLLQQLQAYAEKAKNDLTKGEA
jgi:hypothetical protein